MTKRQVSGMVLALLLASMLLLVFNTQLVKASGTTYIRADGSVDPSTAPIHRDGNVYTLTGNIYDEVVVERDNIVVDGSGYTLQGTGSGIGVYLANRRNVTIKNMKIEAFGRGIRLDVSSDNIISGNNMTNNVFCVGLYESSNDNTVSGNNITNHVTGVRISSSSNNHISGNNITSNYCGVRLEYSNDNTVSGNNIADNTDDGVHLLESSNNNTVSGNNIANNYCGVRLEYSNDNTVSGNVITSSDYGVRLYWAHKTNISRNDITNHNTGVRFSQSTNNSFYHNNLIDNTQQVSIYAGCTCFWDYGYPSGGNYWSDYTGFDLFSGPDQDQLGGDGIGDTSYIIDGNNIDHYPLITPYPRTKFDVVVIPSTDFAAQGTTVTASVYVSAVAGYDCLVSLSASGQPEGVAVDFNPNTETPSFISTMTVQVGCSVPLNTYSITVTGLGSDDTTRSATYMLTVTAFGAIYIRADGSVDPPTAPIHRVGNIYTLTGSIYNEVVVERDDIVVDGAGYSVQSTGNPAPKGTGIYLPSRNNVTIKDVEVRNFYCGIYLEHSISNVLSGNTALNNSCGIELDRSNYNTISGNNVTANGLGISIGSYFFGDSNYNTISGNNVTANGLGISIGTELGAEWTSDNTISGNNVAHNGRGIGLAWTSRNIISRNNITDSTSRGVNLEYASGNTFYHNNFINNRFWQVYDEAWNPPWWPPSKCTWDNGYPSGGNFWSDYTGVDRMSGPHQNQLGGDGIGDSWYWIRGEVDYDYRDRYPLLKPYGTAHDIGITEITPSETSVGQGSMLDIHITVMNYGLYTEAFNLTAYANTTIISQAEVTLSSKDSAAIPFTWDTTGVPLGTYMLRAQASIVPGETDTTDNTLVEGHVTIDIYDIAVIQVTVAPTCVKVGETVHINVTVANQGSTNEPLVEIITYCNESVVELWGCTLDAGESITHGFSWNTIGIAAGRYIISAFAIPVPNEIDTADNYLEDGVVTVVTPVYLTQKLIETIETWDLHAGTERSLTSKLEEALHLLGKGNENGAVHKLMDFIHQVEGLRDKKLTTQQADQLTSEAQKIIDLIEEETA